MGQSATLQALNIRQHGKLYAESKAGEGATFIIELPVGNEQPDTESSHFIAFP